jgi:large subunit ribosomal protein L23Ae
LKKGSGRKATKVHNKVHFYKPKTLQLARAPKVLKQSAKSMPKLDAYSVIKYPLTTESAMKKIEDNNTLVFIVDVKANKRQIKDAVNKLYAITAAKVNTLIRWVYFLYLILHS